MRRASFAWSVSIRGAEVGRIAYLHSGGPERASDSTFRRFDYSIGQLLSNLGHDGSVTPPRLTLTPKLRHGEEYSVTYTSCVEISHVPVADIADYSCGFPMNVIEHQLTMRIFPCAWCRDQRAYRGCERKLAEASACAYACDNV